MARPKRNLTRMHLHVEPEVMARVAELVGPAGTSQFVREAIRQRMDAVAPGEADTTKPFFEYAGQPEPRLTASSRAILLAKMRSDGSLDKTMTALGYSDPVEFLHALAGHTTLPDRAVSALVFDILPTK